MDYDDEPIYVGQTTEKLRTRIRRHLTNQRTDAVAMRVLDPFEVAEVEMWPFWDLEGRDVGDTLDRAEFTVYQEALAKSKFRAVLNEGEITKKEMIDLPPSVRGALLSDDARQSREHSDLRLARRARTIADLARVISERQVKRRERPSPAGGQRGSSATYALEGEQATGEVRTRTVPQSAGTTHPPPSRPDIVEAKLSDYIDTICK